MPPDDEPIVPRGGASLRQRKRAHLQGRPWLVLFAIGSLSAETIRLRFCALKQCPPKHFGEQGHGRKKKEKSQMERLIAARRGRVKKRRSPKVCRRSSKWKLR